MLYRPTANQFVRSLAGTTSLQQFLAVEIETELLHSIYKNSCQWKQWYWSRDLFSPRSVYATSQNIVENVDIMINLCSKILRHAVSKFPRANLQANS